MMPCNPKVGATDFLFNNAPPSAMSKDISMQFISLKARRWILPVLGTLVAAIPAFAYAQAAETFPTKPVKVIVSFTPGSITDTVARVLAEDVRKEWNQSVVVENRVGGDGIVSAQAAATAPPDGYTVYLTTLGIMALNPHLHPKLPYDPVRDFTGVTFVAENPFAIAVSNLPVKSVADLVAYSKANPGKVRVGVAGVFAQVVGETFRKRSGADITLVPYKGIPQANADFTGGHVEAVIGDLPTVMQLQKNKIGTVLAVTSTKRSKIAPGVPTMIESGVKDFDFSTWYAFVVPARTPADVVSKLNSGLGRSLRKPEVTQRLLDLGLDAQPSPAQAVTDLVRTEVARWGPIVKASGVKAD